MKKYSIAALLFSFMMTVFAPLEIYFANKGYFFFEGNVLLGRMAILFVIGIVISWLVLLASWKIGNKFFKVIYGMFVGGITGLYLQGNWDLTDYGAWNGDDIVWGDFKTQLLVWCIIWVILLTVAIWFSVNSHDKFVKVTNYICVFVGMILIYTLVVLSVQNGGFKKEEEFVATTSEELHLSDTQNLVVLVADTYDGAAFSKIINENSRYKELFEGFTFFPDTVGGYTSTDMSIPLIVTGEGYENRVTYGEYLNFAYKESKLLSYLSSNGWNTGIYTDQLLPQADSGISNLKKMKRIPSDNTEIVRRMYELVLFRYLPQPLKKVFVFNVDEMKLNYSKLDSDMDEAFTEDNLLFERYINELESNGKAASFQLIHIDGSHPPFHYNSRMELCDYETSYEEECEAVLYLVEKLISELKAKDLYDCTALVIMGDHGYYNYRENPLFLVKGMNEKHEMEESDIAISYFDLQGGFINLANGKNSRDSFEEYSYKDKTRVLRSVPWNTHLNYDNYSGLMKEYAMEGSVYSPLSYGFDGREFGPASE